jgi:hypothetical protein
MQRISTTVRLNHGQFDDARPCAWKIPVESAGLLEGDPDPQDPGRPRAGRG